MMATMNRASSPPQPRGTTPPAPSAHGAAAAGALAPQPQPRPAATTKVGGGLAGRVVRESVVRGGAPPAPRGAGPSQPSLYKS